jgi:hypothetical protein
MKTSRIFFLLFFMFVVPSLTYAQQSRQSAADKSWNAFWTQFSAAVRNKDTKALKRLMSSENAFFSGGAVTGRDELLRYIKDQNRWGEYRPSVASGIKKESCGLPIPCRVTKDDHLTFAYINGRWRWTGLVGH